MFVVRTRYFWSQSRTEPTVTRSRQWLGTHCNVITDPSAEVGGVHGQLIGDDDEYRIEFSGHWISTVMMWHPVDDAIIIDDYCCCNSDVKHEQAK